MMVMLDGEDVPLETLPMLGVVKEPEVIAREDIKRGEIVRKLWTRFARPVKHKSDIRIWGVSLRNTKKGERVSIATRGYAQIITDGTIRTSRG